jgi:hypothetical protein
MQRIDQPDWYFPIGEGLTRGKIAAHQAEVYGVEVPKQTITTITGRVMEGLTDEHAALQ